MFCFVFLELLELEFFSSSFLDPFFDFFLEDFLLISSASCSSIFLIFFLRIASCFFDKIVDGLFNFKDASGDKLNVSFNDFLSVIKSQNRIDRNEHWRNQSDFLHYEKYDDYFSLESFVKAIQSLDKRGFIVHDTRSLLDHDLSSMNRVEGDFSKMKEIEIKKMREEGTMPSYKSMFTQSEIELVNDIYKDDIDLYKTQFGEKNLLF